VYGRGEADLAQADAQLPVAQGPAQVRVQHLMIFKTSVCLSVCPSIHILVAQGPTQVRVGLLLRRDDIRYRSSSEIEGWVDG
jgi:hypothetical protein